MSKGWNIKGLKELKDDLRKLPITRQVSILRTVNRKALTKTIVPKLTSAIPHKAKKVRSRTKKDPFKKVNKKQVIVTTIRGDKTAMIAGISSKYFHYRFIEFGTRSRTTKKGAARGSVFARPFASRVLDTSIYSLIKYLKTEYNKHLAKQLRK